MLCGGLNISSALGLLTAIIGLTTTLQGGWKYLSDKDRSHKERVSAIVVVVVIMGVVIGGAAGLSHVTATTPVGKQTIPVPFVPTAATSPAANPAHPQTAPTAAPAETTTPEHAPTLTPTSVETPTVTPAAGTSPTVMPTRVPTQPPTK